MRYRILLILLLLDLGTIAQQLRQNIRGEVIDAETNFPLSGVVIRIYRDTLLLNGGVSDENGKFAISDCPVGKVKVVANFAGYLDFMRDALEVTSAKEVILKIPLQQSAIEMTTLEIVGTSDGEVVNEMALISARQFSVAETDRYAGSRGDPARMASNFAGVQGADDSRNDIVIRGNSPQGVLWRMEGIDLPNPNHFAIPGTAGGPVGIINNKYLANSDFFTGAFPADYGNSVAGVFDLRMRNGNNQKHEFSGQFGFLGTELFAEGPISREKGSSYLASYRYSTLALFSRFGIDIGTAAVPLYQDGAFRVFLPAKKRSSWSLWGLGGMSRVDILISDQKSPDERNIYGENDRDQYFKSKTGVVGATNSLTINESTYLKTTFALSNNTQDSHHDLVYRHLNTENQYVVDSLSPLLEYTFVESKATVAGHLSKKINRQHSLKLGWMADHYWWNDVDSVRTIDTTAVDYYQWRTRWNANAQAFLLQAYAQWKYRPTDRLTISAGWHTQAFTLNKSYSFIEPRVGIRWQVNNQQSVQLGVGRHSQMQPTYMYFYEPSAALGQINRMMDFTMSDHYVLGHEWMKGHWRIKTEAYYQRVFNIPVDQLSSSFSLVNTGAGFSRFFPGRLENKGTAENKGLELTIERFYHKGWLFLFSASLFDSKYKGSDGIERNTDFNGRYAMNILSSKEWKIGENRSLVVGGKITRAGGRWYGPADEEASTRERELIYVDSLRNTLQFKPYFRFDTKVNLKINKAKTTHEIGLDLVNVLNTKNVLKLTYAPDENSTGSAIREEYQLGFLPIFYYKIDW